MSCEWGGQCHSDLRRRRVKLVQDFDSGPFWILVVMSLVFVAQEELPSGAVSDDLPLSSLTSPVPVTSKFRVSLDSKRRLTSTGGKWPLSHMKLSEDIHCCTAVLERGVLHETVRLVIVKSVARDDEIVIWFSLELLAAMDVPFLNPMNIQGEKTYKCHRCGKVYEYPNPLKLHLARSCDEMKLADLWRRLADALRLHSSPSVVPRIVKPHEFILKLSLKETGGREKGKVRLRERPGTPPSPALTSYSSPSPERVDSRMEDQRPSSEPPRNSAFRPYSGSPHPQMERLYPETSLIETASTFSNQQLQSAFCSKEIFLHNQAAEIETLVSNLGQSKQGHLCLYCGKIYSRKYGLKIHIRTHTGFKPLKCKYCLRPFGDPSNLNKHVRLHADTETPYRCDLCGKMLVRRRDLDRHIKSRHSSIIN